MKDKSIVSKSAALTALTPDNKKCVRHVFVWHGGISDSSITDCKEDNVFRNVCQSFCSQGEGGLPSGQRASPGQRPSGQRPSGQRPPGQRLPTPSGHCIGGYASYWNTFLFSIHDAQHKNNITAIITVILSTVGVEKPIEGNENINDLFIPSKYRSESDKDQRTNRKDKK